MLDSLVRVSRRVGGAADLLATEMQAVPVKTLAVRACLATRRVRSQEREAQVLASQAPNFTRALGPAPAVRCVNGRRNAATGSPRRRAGSSRIPDAAARPTLA